MSRSVLHGALAAVLVALASLSGCQSECGRYAEAELECNEAVKADKDNENLKAAGMDSEDLLKGFCIAAYQDELKDNPMAEGIRAEVECAKSTKGCEAYEACKKAAQDR